MTFIVQGRTDPAHAPATLRALRFGEAAQRAAFMNAMADPAPAPEAAEAILQLRQEIESVEKDIAAKIDSYDRRRAALQPYKKQRGAKRFGEAPFYGWSEDKARQYAEPQRVDFMTHSR